MADPTRPLLLSRARCALLVAVGSLLLTTACSGGSTEPDADAAVVSTVGATDETDETDETAEPSGTAATTEPVAYSIPSREPVDGLIGLGGAAIDDDPRGFASHVDFVRHGVELGVWTESEGVIALLQAQLGEIPISSIEGLDLVITSSGTSLLHLAFELAAADTTSAADRDEIERLLARLTPSAEMLDELAALDIDAGDTGDAGASSEGEPSGFRRPAGGAHPAQTDGCELPKLEWFAHGEGVQVDCWKMLTDSVHRGGGSGFSRLRVVYPEGELTQAEATMEALIRTVQVGHEWTDVNPDATALIIPDTMRNAKGEVVWAVTTALSARSCAITASVESALGLPYQQAIAHEMVHCLQLADFGKFSKVDFWFIEGGANYFSHVIYPDAGVERKWLDEFLSSSLTTGLAAMSYQTWPWWQHLSNLSSPVGVWDLHRRMTHGDPVAVLAAEPGMAATFQSFTIDLTTVGVPTHGAPIEPSPYGLDAGRIASTGDRSRTVDRFVAARLGVFYAERHLFEQADHTTTDGLMQMVTVEQRHDRSAWRGLPPEVRSSCESDVSYIMVATTVGPDPHEVEWSVDVADEYSCDPCLGGTWIVDNDSFRDTIMTFVTADIPAGMNFGIDLVGPYYVRFDGSGAGNAWRDDWQIVAGGTVEGMTMDIITTISSVETFDYGADGERFDAWNAIVHDYRTAMTMSGLPMTAVATPGEAVVNVFGVETTVGTTDDGAQHSGGDYTCSRSQLVLALDDAPGTAIVLDRTTDIPQPPLVLSDP